MSRDTKNGPDCFPVCGTSNAHAQSAVEATDIFDWLSRGPYYMNNKGSKETALMRRLA